MGRDEDGNLKVGTVAGELWFAASYFSAAPLSPIFSRNRRVIQAQGIAGLVGSDLGVRVLHSVRIWI